jgi:hypothetical protein
MTRAKDISKIVTDADLSGTLDVTGTVTAGDVTMTRETGGYLFNTGGSTRAGIRSDDQNNLTLRAGTDAIKMHVGADGKVGIGETSPQGNLHIKGSDSGVTSSPSHADELIIENSTNGGMTFNCGASNSATITFQNSTYSDDGALQYRNGDRAMAFKTAGSERMRITSAGNVGIGDSNPQRKISVNGIAKFRNSITLGGSNSSTDYNAYFVNEAFANNADTNSVTLGTHSTRPLIFATNTTERMRIGSNGGTVLTANASGAYAFKVINDGNASNRFGIAIQTGEDSPTTTNYLMGFQDGNGNSVGSITFNNAGQTSFNQISDYRLKENVTEDWNATTRLKELKPCRFNFKRFPNTTLDGFIAHEAQEVVPEAVIGEKDAVDDDGNPIYQGIDQSKLVPLLVKTIQELEARIVALETA